ncbi:MAG: helical backbone metal receptor [Vicinamibacterales bacterium]|jgi:iron complex transport system substrate-binding protein|nr:helical backbone metal receptor [Vicinamibacterales bacterium]|tara:strand:- start:4578 stop:5507 length:930 start_codon:yes stop_codon:yes gene_type:complete
MSMNMTLMMVGKTRTPTTPGLAGRVRRLTLAAAIVLVAGLGAQTPQRIVSVIPAVTEILFAIGAGSEVVGVGSYDQFPPEIANLPRIGGLIDPDIETIIALRPDLVVPYATQVDLVAQLGRAGIPLFQYSHGTLSDVLTTIRQLGDRTGHARQAEDVARGIEADLAAIAEAVSGRRRPRTLLVIAREPGSLRNLFASGGSGFQHDMLWLAGGENVFDASVSRAAQVTTETILQAAPDVVLEVRAGQALSPAEVAREVAVWQALPSLPAVRNGRVVFLTGNDLVIPGPRIVQGVTRFAGALHPDVALPTR